MNERVSQGHPALSSFIRLLLKQHHLYLLSIQQQEVTLHFRISVFDMFTVSHTSDRLFHDACSLTNHERTVTPLASLYFCERPVFEEGASISTINDRIPIFGALDKKSKDQAL